jgi:hypothetical protein
LYYIYSKKLYKAYKGQIQTFLNNIYNVPTLIKSNLFNSKKSIFLNKISKENVYYDKFNLLFTDIDLENKEKLISLITYYNPNSHSFFSNQKIHESTYELEVLSQIKKLYFQNQNFFSRYVILLYLFNYDLSIKISFLKDIYNVSDLRLKMIYLENLCLESDINTEDNYSFFKEKITDCIVEIMWTEATINDLNKKGFDDLTNELDIHHNLLIEMLLNLLELISNKKTIKIVKNIYNKTEKTEDDLIFIVELLDNVLPPELSKIVSPIFEPINYTARANKLNIICFHNELASSERLSDILMYNYNMVNSYTKQLALKHIKNSTSNKNIIPAFQSSQIPNLKMVASVSDEDLSEDYVDYFKIYISNELSNYFSLNYESKTILLRWGFRNINSYKKSNDQTRMNYDQFSTVISPTNQLIRNFEIDLIAPYLLTKMNYFNKLAL